MLGLFKDTQSRSPTPKKAVAIGGVFALLAGLEAMAYIQRGAWSIVASWIWLAGTFYLFGSSVWLSVAELIRDVKKRRYAAPIIMLAFCVLTFWGAGIVGIRWVDYESAQEIGAGINSWKTLDRGYMSLAHWGYPVRQYAFLAIPSLVFGKSLLSINLAFDFVFVAAALSMHRGLKSLLKPVAGYSGTYASVMVFAVYTSPIVLLFTRVSEQSMLSSAMTMMAIGSFLCYMRKGKPGDAVRLGFAGGFLGAMYTPGLASAALLAAALAYMAIAAFSEKTRRDSAILDLGLCLYIIVVAAVTLLLIKARGHMTVNETTADFVKSSLLNLAKEDPYGLFRGVTILALAYMALSLAGFLTAYDLYLSIWAVLVVLMSLMMKGVSDNSYFSVQRATPIVPVLVTAMGYHIIAMASRFGKARKWIALGLAGGIAAISVAFNVVKPIYPKNISKANGLIQTRVAGELQRTIKEEGLDSGNLTLLYYVDNTMIKNIYDYLKYFEPAIKVVIVEEPLASNDLKDGDYIIAAISDASIPDDLVALYGEPARTMLDSGVNQLVFESIAINN